ncbi:vesicular glutamate transporter 3-like [Babylonia areolata]|uniref:vesicular glutamate transporter 3-like n=1 Tax=Babylonia areolata TaxID=304850 RepID=UPI003FD2A2C9
MGLLLGMVHLPQGVGVGPMVGMYVLIVAFTSFEGCTWQPNIVDLTPRFSGLISSVAQAISLTASFCLPLAVAALTPHNTEQEWQTCVLVSFVIVTVSYLIYLCWGSSEQQDWGCDNPKPLLLEDKTESETADEPKAKLHHSRTNSTWGD